MIATSALMALAMCRRIRHLARVGPVQFDVLLERIDVERRAADVVDLHPRRVLHLPPASRQRRAA